MKKIFSSTLFLLLVLLASSGCTSSTLVNSWKEPEWKASSFKKVFVISVNNNNNKRKIWEDAFVKSLKTYGIKGIPSYDSFPKAAPDEKELGEFLGNKFDAVIMVHKVNEETQKYRTPGMTILTPIMSHRSHFFRSYASIYHEIYLPGRIQKEKIYTLETCIYEPREDGRLIWNAITETRNPKSTEKFSGEITEIVMKNMAKDGFLPHLD